MHQPTIIIIDDNGHNGDLLSRACRQRFPEWRLVWLRVTNMKPDPIAPPRWLTYKVIGTQDDAVAAIKLEAGDDCDLIVFYDLQLTGVQDQPESAPTSPITLALKRLMRQSRRMLVNVHSASMSSALIAAVLDKYAMDLEKRRVMSEAVVTRMPGSEEGDLTTHVDKVVGNTFTKWESLYPPPQPSAEEFLCAMEGMKHEQIQNYPLFLEKTEKAEGASREVLRTKYPDPSDVLRRYFGMSIAEFKENFCDENGNVKEGISTALKGISGVIDFDTGKSECRRLRWDGAWLLALGQFRNLSPRDRWKNVFDADALDDVKTWPEIHAWQSSERRGKTLRLFVQMCAVLFCKKGTKNESVLERVSLTLDEEGEPHTFSFLLSFPCINRADRESSLFGKILAESDHALAVTGGGIADKESHDTSQAIWRLLLSSGMCDREDEVCLESEGMFAGFSRMNVVSVEEGTKTKIVWVNQ
jgi:hypothetical protein